jgi:SNF2 family DNA or RNA helicase
MTVVKCNFCEDKLYDIIVQVVSRPSRDDWKKIPESKVYKGGNNLRDYQLEGVNWLTFNWYKQ